MTCATHALVGHAEALLDHAPGALRTGFMHTFILEDRFQIEQLRRRSASCGRSFPAPRPLPYYSAYSSIAVGCVCFHLAHLTSSTRKR